MRRALVLVSALAVLVPFAGAATLTDVSVSKQELWVEEAYEVTAACDPANQTLPVTLENLTRTTVDGSTVWTPGLAFDANPEQAGAYFLRSSTLRDYLASRGSYAPGRYRFAVACGSGNSSDVAFGNVTVRDLVLSVEEGLGSGPFYTGERVKALVDVRVEAYSSTPVWDGNADRPTFWIDTGDGREALPHWFDADTKYWALNVTLPDDPGTRDIDVIAEYAGTEARATETVTVREALDYTVEVSKLTVSPGETIELTVSAAHRGSPLRVARDDITVRVDGDVVGSRLTAESIAEGSSTFTLQVPDRAPGTYPLRVELDAYDAVATRELAYPLEVMGSFTGPAGDTPFELVFEQGNSRVASITGRGEYTGRLLPGHYNVTARFGNGRATARFEGVDVETWDDPIRYARYTDADVPGLVLGGLYAYRTSLAYDTAALTMQYDTSGVRNPERLKVYRCEGWNFARAACFTQWEEVVADFNHVNSRVSVETGSLSAYAIGRRDALKVLHGHETASYLPDGTVSFGGMVQDGDGDPVSNVTVDLALSPGGVTRTATTDDSGRYTFSFPVPDGEGTYTATVGAAREPYADGSTTFTFEVDRPPRIAITTPDSVTLQQNSTRRVDVFVKNTGYTAIDDLEAVTDDIPLLERVAYNRAPLERNESRRVTFVLSAGPNATPETHTATARFRYADTTDAQVFGVTVEEVETRTASRTSLTGNLPLSGMSSALTEAAPSGVPVTTIVLVVLLVQGSVVAFFFLRTRLEVEHPVIGTVSTVREEVENGRLFGGEGPERENVLRAVNHIKEELDR